MQTLGPHPELPNQSLYFHKTPGESFAQQSLRSSALDQVSVTCHESFVITITGHFLKTYPQYHFLGVWPLE